ncbi:MAG TPA: hypothetical protein VKT25_04315 [Ktedonobacteraceae bacterium]|nr:hypothetical protein [Ktedonobacteraceae bacterium]
MPGRVPNTGGGHVHFRPGQTIEAGPTVFSTGGSVSNTGLALHKLGVATRLMAKIGTDLFGCAARCSTASPPCRNGDHHIARCSDISR